MTRVLVTGATGFVGGRLAHRLRERGDDVIALVRTPSPNLDQLGIEQVQGAFEAVDDTLISRTDAIVHAAASIGPDPDQARAVNRHATALLADHARRRAIPLVHVSTVSVYEQSDELGQVDESAPLKTEGSAASAASSSPNWYGITKAEGEIEVAKAVADGLTAAVLRPPAVLGAGPTSTWGVRVPGRLRDGSWTPPHPDTTFAWVHVDDLVDAITAALDAPVDATLHVIGGHTTFGTYVDALHDVVPGMPPTADPAPDDAPWIGTFTTDRLSEVLGVSPHRTFDDGIAEIAAWWREQAAE